MGATTRCRARHERVTGTALDGWSPDGTAIVAVRIDQGDGPVTMHHVVTPLATSYAVTVLFYDLDDIAAHVLRPL